MYLVVFSKVRVWFCLQIRPSEMAYHSIDVDQLEILY